MRKQIFCALLLSSLPFAARGVETKLPASAVPAPVTAGAKKEFPAAKLSGWSKEAEAGKTTYEVSVADGKGKRDAVFSETGSLLAVEQSITVADLPPPVAKAVMAKYPHAILRKAEKISHDGTVDYEVLLSNASQKEVTFSSGGKFLKAE